MQKQPRRQLQKESDSLSDWDRREFLKFVGKSSLALTSATTLLPWLSACDVLTPPLQGFPLTPIPATQKDDLILSPELNARVLIRWNDPIGPKKNQTRFGFNNDFIEWIPTSPTTGILWVNHEYPDPLFVSGYSTREKVPKSIEQIQKEKKSVGGSLLQLKKNPTTERWEGDFEHPMNRRLDATTPIAFAWPEPISGSRVATGTLANCAGGKTDWNTILTCEENYQFFYGSKADYQWERDGNHPDTHYGWVVKVNPLSESARKLVSLGRFSHESATFTRSTEGLPVVYSGDDAQDECLYKFIGSTKNSLAHGTLYVANLQSKTWVPLDFQTQPSLQKAFKNQTEVLIHAREAAKLVGGTPLDRPEDIAIHPNSKDVFVALTNHAKKRNYYGSLMKLKEANQDPGSLSFEWETFLWGGKNSELVCPDNLAFDPKGNLWVTSDISGTVINHGPYAGFGNNGLFLIPMSGLHAGNPIRVASAPVNAELTGPCFTPDGKTLFLSVQHPGEYSPSPTQLKSHWPDGGNTLPKPAVVEISLSKEFWIE